MAIFNSLGSNYNLTYVLKSLLSKGSKADFLKLEHIIEERYGGKTLLFYKGREAISGALKILNLPEDSKIAINGFTCVAVFNAIRTAGYEPICLDLEKKSNLNFSPDTLNSALKKDKSIKAVIVQNTLGYPTEIDKIEEICKKHKLLLIEDLAHCIGTKYSDGREAGTIGDFIILSFSQDKIIDAVSGGALVIRNKKYQNKMADFKLSSPANVWRDKIYPHLTYKIRSLYGFGLGKPYHFLLKNLGLMTNLMNEGFYNYLSLPYWHAAIAVSEFDNLEEQLRHRKKITKIYAENLNKSLIEGSISKDIELSSCLRFPIFTENREGLIEKLKANNVYLSDIWYVDVAPECSNAVSTSKIIINLPTHINVSEADAHKIVGIINSWIK